MVPMIDLPIRPQWPDGRDYIPTIHDKVEKADIVFSFTRNKMEILKNRKGTKIKRKLVIKLFAKVLEKQILPTETPFFSKALRSELEEVIIEVVTNHERKYKKK